MTFDLVIVWYAVQQRWRYILLAVGVVSLFSAPFVSEWVPFYYTSSMAIGVLAVALILLLQRSSLYFWIVVASTCEARILRVLNYVAIVFL